MKKIYFVIILLTLYGSVFGQLTQFRMIGSGTWTTVNDSTFSSTVTIQADLTANGFLPTGIVDSMKVFTQTGQRYRISSVSNKTFSSADLVVVESGGNWGSPVGQVLIYETRGRSSVPSIPFSATGATAKMQEAADTYNSSLIVEGIGDVTTAQLADSTAAIRADLSPVPADTIRSIVYAPAHGYTLGSFTASIIAVKNNYETANATHLDSIQYLYVVGVPDVDSLEVKGTGEVYRPSHGLAVGSTYYLQNTPNSSYGLSPGTVSSPVFFVLDSDNILLLGQGATAKEVIPRKLIPASIITSFGGEPFAPHDTVIQNIAEVFAANGTITPPTILITQSSGSTRNAVHQGATGDPSTPANSWLWDGALVTRLSYATVSVSMQDTVWGTLFNLPLDTVELIAGVPTDSTVADWLETNYTTNGLRLKNGDMMYWGGTKTSPDYIWEVVDDLNTIGISGGNWDKIIKRIKQPGGGFTEANTFYVDPNGDNTTGLKGRKDKPFDLPWSITPLLDTTKQAIFLNPGNYSINTDASNNSHFFINDSTYIFAYGANIHQNDVDLSATPLITDYIGSFGPTRARNINISGGSWKATRGSVALILGGVRIANPQTVANINIDKLTLKNGRTFGFIMSSNGVGYVREIDIDGGIALGVGGQLGSDGVITPITSRNLDLTADIVRATGLIDNNGLIRYQSDTRDSSSTIKITSNNTPAPPNGVKPFLYSNAKGIEQSYVSISVLGTYDWNNSSNPPFTGFVDGPANNLASRITVGSTVNSSINIRMENLRIINGPFIASYHAIDKDTLDNTTLVLSFSQAQIDTGNFIMLSQYTLRNNSKLIIECDNCHSSKSALISAYDIDIDATSQLLIRGNWSTDAAAPVIQTRVGMTLEGQFTNSGTVPAIESDVATTVFVKGAFNVNSIVLDPDVTIVRLNEYGAGGDGNGIYTGSDTLISEVTSVKMNMQGDQNFLIGKFGEFGYDGTENEAGLFIDPYNWGGVGLANSNGTNYGYYYISDNGRQDFYSSTSGGSISLILGSPDSDSGVTFSKNTSSISSSMGVDVRRGGFNLSRPGVGFSAGIRHSYKAGDLSIARLGNNVPTVERFKHNFVVTLAVGGIAKTTFRIGPDTTSASITALDRTWINENYYFAPFAPSSASSVKSIQVQTGNGTTADPSWETKADFVGTNGSASNTTDGSGDLTIMHGLGVSDIAVSITPTGTTPYHTTVHTKTTTTFKIRFFDTSGAAVTSTAVTADWAARKN